MPELPDIVVYIEALEERILGQTLQRVRLNSPFLVRSVEPPLNAAEGASVHELRRIGKRIAIGLDIGLDSGLWLVLHLMIAGRLHWKKRGIKLAGRNSLAAFDFPAGSLLLTEAGSQRRASLHVVKGLAGIDRGGLEVLEAERDAFALRLTSENHTLKRALTDPRLFSGIGNAYSDEILHRARLSPVALTQRLSPPEITALFEAARTTLHEWVARLRAEREGKFPEGVTAFREGMAVHGRYGQPCPVCGMKIRRIRNASNETNYCPGCQTEGRLLADRALSRLLHSDWPRTVEEWEKMVIERREGG